MLAITNTFTVFAANNKKDFKKLGKKVQKQRQGDIDRIKDKLSDIAKDETERVKQVFQEHKKLFEKGKPTKKIGKTSIDFYEK
jgi:CTP-dependent riboflavin kinase